MLTPLGGWLWWQHYDGNLRLAALAVLIPILFAYIVPGIGTNVLKVWEFNTRWKLGNFRPHHGFVFGSATAILLLPVMGASNGEANFAEIVRTGLLAAGVWDWSTGSTTSRPSGLEFCVSITSPTQMVWAEANCQRLCPWFFGGFGLIHAMGLRYAEGRFSGDGEWSPMRFLCWSVNRINRFADLGLCGALQVEARPLRVSSRPPPRA